jgi:signal transduction histidine kinase/streptogramin lyase
VQLSSSRFQTFGADEGLRLGSDQLLLESRSGQILVFDINSMGIQFYRQDAGRRFTAIRPSVPEPGNPALQTSIVDHYGALWVSTISGLFRLRDVDSKADLNLLPESGVGRFFEDSSGDVWISHWPHGATTSKLSRWERRSGLVHDESQQLPPDARMGISAFAQDHAGTIWIGQQPPGGRLLRMKNGRFQPLSASWSGHINMLFVDSKGRLWATSTESGLGLIADPQSSDPQLRRFTRREGLSADEVWCVTEDRLGRTYVCTAKGIDRLDPDTGQIVHYTSADGLAPGDIRSALRDHNGSLWFVSSHGLTKFTPSDDRAAPPLRARIVGVRAAGVSLPLSAFGDTEIGPLRVSSHQNSFQIDFSTIDFRPGALRYQFQLEREGRMNADHSWQELGATPTVHLLDLSPGDFAFKVRALSSDGSSGEPAFLTFSILQPFWRTWWFQVGCALAIAGLAYWMHARRLQQQLAIERVRSHIAMDLHDDIGAGLSRISVVGEALKSRLRDGDEDVQRVLNDNGDSSIRLIADMGDIVWSLDPRHDRIGEIVSRLRSFGSDVLEKRGVVWTVNSPHEELDRSVPLEARRQIYLVFKEGIHNIAKHSNAKVAHLRFWFEDGHIYGQLTDDGAGIGAASTDGNGIPSMRARVKQLSGNIEISSVAGGGTSIRIEVPLA